MSFRLKRNEMERNGEIFFNNIFAFKKGFLDSTSFRSK